MGALDQSTWVSICGGPEPTRSDGSLVASLQLDLGPRTNLSEAQLKTVQWLRNLGARPSMKRSKVTIGLNRVTYEQYCRVVAILDKEAIGFEVTQ